jgi:hypothetical protein
MKITCISCRIGAFGPGQESRRDADDLGVWGLACGQRRS